MAQEQQYGGFWARLIALILDNAIVFILLLAALLSLGVLVAAVGLEGPAGLAAWVLVTFVPFLYWPVLESSRWQATVGKRILGLQVTDADGDRMSFVLALMRSLAKIVSSIPFGLGFLLTAFTARKQALHDIIVKTVVVRSGPSQLWKLLLALLVGFVLMVASAAGLFYYVVMPMFKKGFGIGEPVRVEMKQAPQAKALPAQKLQPPQAAATPAPPPAQPAAMAAGTAGTDTEFEAIVGKPLAGIDKPNSTRAGPAILELSTVFTNSVWVKVHLPVPLLGDPTLMPSAVVTVDRVLDADGKDYYDAANTFEKSEFFHRASLTAAHTPVPHLSGIRDVHFKAGANKNALRKVEGKLSLRVPVDPKPVTFDANDTGKDKTAHGAVVRLQSVSGNTANIHYRGAPENMLVVRGLGADGKPLAQESRQLLPKGSVVDNDFTVTFKGPPAKVDVVVAARLIERTYPFSLALGASAGPPATGSAAAAGLAAAVPAQQPVPAPTVKPEAKPAAPALAAVPAPVAAAPTKPAPTPARPAPRPRADPQASPAPQRPLRRADTGCVYKPVMTDEEIARCR